MLMAQWLDRGSLMRRYSINAGHDASAMVQVNLPPENFFNLISFPATTQGLEICLCHFLKSISADEFQISVSNAPLGQKRNQLASPPPFRKTI